MLSTTFVLLLTAPFAVLAQTCTSSTTQSCSTVMATIPQWWPVLTNTRTSLLATTTLTGTTTAFTTVTVPAIPITVNTTITTTAVVTSTAQPGTNTFLATTTISVTNTATTTTVTTTTTTSTTTSTTTLLNTSVVPAPSNFISVFQSSGDTNYSGSKKRTDNKKRWLLDFIAESLRSSTTIATPQIPSTSKPHFNVLDWSNPILVNCVVRVAPTCNRAVTSLRTTSVTAAPSTVTSTVRFTSTSTKIVVPQSVTQTIIGASLTSTISTTLLVTSTASATTILTQISTISSTTTTYAACATDNILGPRISDGQMISPLQFYDSAATVLTSPRVSAYDCCVACITGNNCQNFQFQASTGTCWVIGGNQNWCPNNVQDWSLPAYYVTKDAGSATEILSVGNGPCGTTMDAGPA